MSTEQQIKFELGGYQNQYERALKAARGDELNETVLQWQERIEDAQQRLNELEKDF